MKKRLNLIKSIIRKWRKILFLGDIWDINIIVDEELEENVIAAVDISNAEYYKVDLLISPDIFNLDEKFFVKEIETILVHELSHLISMDFMRTALLFSRNNEQKMEIKYKCEKLTSRLQKIFINLEKGRDEK
jgi:hypothetical protein